LKARVMLPRMPGMRMRCLPRCLPRKTPAEATAAHASSRSSRHVQVNAVERHGAQLPP